MIKVFHINCNYLYTTLHQNMIEHLDKVGIDNQVFVPIYDKNISVIKPNSNVIVSECFKKRDRVLFQYKSKKIYQSIKDVCNFDDVNLIHAYTLFTDGNIAYKLNAEYGIPYVVTVRNTDVNTFLRYMIHLRGLGTKIMQNASAIFFLSPSYKKAVFCKYISESIKKDIENKSYVIPNGIDNFWFNNIYKGKRLRNDSKKIRVIYAGRVEKNKNIRTTQIALEILRRKGIETSFVIVGKIVDKGYYLDIVKDKCTNYIEAQPKEKLIELYRNADVFVMPSHHETFGLVYAEAMSQGLPVIYTKGQGFDEQFPDGTVGYAVNDNDPHDIAKKIELTMTKYKQISEECLRCVSKFRWNKLTGEYKKIYEKCKCR